ncbi:hypothetical protein DTL42_12985 [Bremerella cremea]|uniref:Uncharacterized protein n=1 Tax=Bremerella cremea TaxID=1031537 RepID=A0A368KRD2_9BACT|nr:hypothetical protein [Bremerella cremea]RCS49435.1 hypothetical protein DTL42_12985 [Bremerella cremea]
MRAFCYWLTCMFLIGILACNQKPSAPKTTANETSALTVETWKTLPIPEKYDGATLERLRMHDDKLKSERAWKKFMHDVIGPEMRTDLPRPDLQ